MKTRPNMPNALVPKTYRRFHRVRHVEVELLARWRPINGHVRQAPLANKWLLAARVEAQLARNSTRHHRESLMKYPG